MRKSMLLAVVLISMLNVYAEPVKWTKRFYYDLDRYTIRYDLRNNMMVMDSTAFKLKTLLNDPRVENLRLEITSSSSLEASDAYNSRLSANRTGAFLVELRKRVDIPFEVLFVHDNVFDWDHLYQLVAKSQCPERDRALNIITSVPTTIANQKVDNTRKLHLQELANGEAYRYMMEHIFPDMRNTAITISYNLKPVANDKPDDQHAIEDSPQLSYVLHGQTEYKEKDDRNFVFAVKTNMLYDAGMTPNLGIEFYVAPNVSLSANWMYAWWKKDRTSFYWRTYGGDVEARYYIGNREARSERTYDRAFKGHHVGLYGSLTTYDYEFGGNGQQAAKWNYGGGIAYGYSLGITPRLNIDFGLGLGCLYGKYHKYEPSAIDNDDYYKISTHQRRYWGPTKAEISLVWKLGR